MKIYLNDQLTNPAYPPRCVVNYTGAALPIELCGIPMFYGGLRVSGVKVSVTNADSVAVEATCERRGEHWFALFAATNFASYGFVSKGFKVTLVLKDEDDNVSYFVLAIGDVEVRSSSSSSSPGDPSGQYVTKGGELYVRSNVVEGVQHYVKQEMSFDQEIGWGASWTGDYILSNTGTFVPANAQ